MAPVIDDPNSSTRLAPDYYLGYLNSADWRATRNAALRRAGYRCNRCGSKRDPNVHHRSYERLGAERPEDLEVLCFQCHNGHHLRAEAAEPSKVYVRLVSEVVTQQPFAQVADIADETKRLCVKHRVPVDVPLINKAIALVCATRLKDGDKPYRSVVERPETYDEPVSQAQTVELLRRLRVALKDRDGVVGPRRMPKVRVVTAGEADKLKAFAMVTREMEDCIARCEELEQGPRETA